VTGCKRNILVDTMGALLAVLVHLASANDGQRAPLLVKCLAGIAERLEVIYTDEGTPPRLAALVFGWTWRIFRQSSRQKGGYVATEAMERRADGCIAARLPAM
jgi:hypothetical protein